MTQWDIKLKPVPFVMTTGGSDLQENCNFHETFQSKRKLNKKTHFGQKAASWHKIKEKRPHLKFNFTTRTSSIYLSRPFLKLGNGNRLTLVLLLHISTF